MFFLFKLFRKKEESKLQPGGPYRVAAEMPTPIHDPPPPKPKRQFKMPKVSKTFKVFLHLIPICGCLVSLGTLYDAPVLGLGLKWGISAAVVVVGAFFSIRTLQQANEPT